MKVARVDRDLADGRKECRLTFANRTRFRFAGEASVLEPLLDELQRLTGVELPPRVGQPVKQMRGQLDLDGHEST